MTYSNYPTSLDTTSNLPDAITDSNTLNSPDHASLHNTVSQATLALEAKLGTGTGSTPTAGKVLTGTGTGSADWTSALNITYNVQSYGATGNGSTNDTTAIQNAINAANAAGGGIVFFPDGTYKISAELTVYTGISLIGASSEAAEINQVTTTANGIYSNDAASISIKGLFIHGPGSGSGVGIALGWTSNGNVPYLDFEDLKVYNWGSDGVAIETPIVSTFNQVVSKGNGGYGFNWYHAGTSCTFNSCWGRENALSGFHFYESVYMTLNSCAADSNAVGYLVENAQSISFNACGAENTTATGGDWDGTSFKISNSSVVGLHNVWVTGNNAIGIWMTNGSEECEVFGAADNSPGMSATAFVQTDESTSTTVSDVDNTTANSYAAGTITILNDGANGLTTRYLYAKGANGTLTIDSDTDGGTFNIFSNESGTLAIYGSGATTLNVNLLDGALSMGGNTTISNSGTLTHVSLDTAGTGNTLKINGTAVSAVTGTGSVVLASSPTITSPTIATGITLPNNSIAAANLATTAITLGYQQITSNVTGVTSTTFVAVSGLSAGVTIPAGGRKVKVTFFASAMYVSTAATLYYAAIFSGATSGALTTQLTQVQATGTSVNAPLPITCIYVSNSAPSAGSIYYTVAICTNTGADAVNLSAGSTYPAFILVEAI